MDDFLSNKELIEKRRTFAIISHPDAGKTTLTEKFLLYGGAINQAGSVKGKKTSKHAVSDWMEIEKQRGISVTSSAMQFEYNGYHINILDTPGHQDFSEDTYRTLMAADSAVMVIDASKGVEKQTKKLFKVCAKRKIPIFTFINKLDRDAKDPYDLIDEIEKVLSINSCPIDWPIGSGKDFKGVYQRGKREILLFSGRDIKNAISSTKISIDDESLKDKIGDELYNTLKDDVELLDGAGSEFNLEEVKRGKLTPVFFGSALTNFGVEHFLNNFLNMTTPPLPRKGGDKVVDPFDDKFTAFVFKIQANMNKAHRDRIAFLRICSGKYEKGMETIHDRENKKIKLSRPQQLMASDRETLSEAYSGDIIGVFDPGIFQIGDTLRDEKIKVTFNKIPTFAPENFASISCRDTQRRKQFQKGVTQIAQEGAIQIFKRPNMGLEELIVGAVGVLQFDVLEYRLKNEYKTDILLKRLPYTEIRKLSCSEDCLNSLDLTSDTKLIIDFNDNNYLIFSSEWSIDWALKHNEGIELTEFSDEIF